MAGTRERAALAVGPKFQSIGRMSSQLDGCGRGFHGSAGGSGVYPSGVVSRRSVRMSTLETPSTMA
jgi:hypothetical protein